MPLALVLIGLIVIVAAVRNKLSDLTSMLTGDFTGPGNFVYFVVAIIVLGALGYVEKLKPLSDAFLILVLLVLFISNAKPGTTGGFFAKFQEAIGKATLPATNMRKDVFGYAPIVRSDANGTLTPFGGWSGDGLFIPRPSPFAPGHGAVGF